MAETITELIQAGADITTTLTVTEKTRLAECEAVIQQNITGFLIVGHALAEIRDNRLYRGTHKNFPKYCKDVWDLSKSGANYQIAGYEIVQNLIGQKVATIGGHFEESDKPATNCGHLEDQVIVPQNERQTRPLTKLTPDDQVKAWGLVLKQLNEGKKLTSYLVAQAAKEVKGETFKKNVKKTKEQVAETNLLSKLFKYQYQVLLDIVTDERAKDWSTSSRKEVVKWLRELVKIAEDTE